VYANNALILFFVRKIVNAQFISGDEGFPDEAAKELFLYRKLYY